MEDKNISLASKVKLMRTLILSTFFYACESWTLTAENERRIQAPEMRCYRRPLNISNKDHVTNEEVRNRIQNAIGEHDDLLTMVKKRKLRWYGHISRSSGMAKTILQGAVKRARRRGRQKKKWEDNIKKMDGKGVWRFPEGSGRQGRIEKGIVATSSAVPRRPPKLRHWDEMRWTMKSPEHAQIWILKLPHTSWRVCTIISMTTTFGSLERARGLWHDIVLRLCIVFTIGKSPRACSKYSHWYCLLLIWGRAIVSSIAIELLCSRWTTRP